MRYDRVLFLYIFLHFFMTFLAERDKVHQILKLASISLKCLSYAFFEFFHKSLPRLFTDLKFRWLFRYSNFAFMVYSWTIQKV